MRNSSAPFKRALSMKDGEMNGANGVSPLHNFVKAKHKINSTFSDIGKFLEDCNNFLSECKIANDSDEDVKKYSSEVSYIFHAANFGILDHPATCNAYIETSLSGTKNRFYCRHVPRFVYSNF